MKQHVALIIETSSIYGRDLLSGIVRFMRVHDQWSVFLEQRDLWKQPPSWLNSWSGDGIITRTTPPKLLEAVAKTGVPLVEVNDRLGNSTLPQVRSDDAAIGRMAAQHLLERGFKNFAFCGFRGEAWSARREGAFATEVERKSDAPCARFNSTWHGPAARAWEDEQDQIMQWLRGLPTPLAILACNDIRGQHLIDACSKLNLAVPEQVAVLGVDNDELLCRMCSPPLSSVIPSAEEVGYLAAETLAALMHGETIQRQIQEVAPLGVATRQSTDVMAIEDREIAASLRYIREHACQGISVDDVVQHSTVSRSTLERQLRNYLGRTPQEEIRHVQINRACELLLATDLPTERIAPLCGFEHPEYLHVVFKRVTQMTPGDYRKKANP